METIAGRVAAIIKESGLTQSKFAARLHIGQSQISAFCSGTRTPTNRVIADICREFGIDGHWLRTGEGEMLRHIPEDETLVAEIRELPQGRDAEIKRHLISAVLRMSPEALALVVTAARQIVAAAGEEKEEAGQ